MDEAEQICWLTDDADLTKVEVGRNWLRGALLAEAAGLLHIMGAVLLRRVAVRTAEKKKKLHTVPSAWACISIRLFAWVVSWCARCFAPDTTVAPIFLSTVLVANLASSPTALHEQFYGREVVVTLGCLISVWLSAVNDLLVVMSASRRVLVFDAYCLSSELRQGIVTCMSVWALSSLFCLALLAKEKFKPGSKRKSVETNSRKKWTRFVPRHPRLAVLTPITLGLLEGAMHFVGYAGFPWCRLLRRQDISYDYTHFKASFCPIAAIIVILAVPATYCELEGAKNYDCRYFVPAYTTVSFTISTILRALLKFNHLDRARMPLMILAQLILLVGPFAISSTTATIKLPRTLAKAAEQQPAPTRDKITALSRNGYVEYLPLTVTPLLEFAENEANSGVLDPEHTAPMLRLDAPKRKAYMWLFARWAAIGRMVPLFILMIIPLFFTLLSLRGGSAGAKEKAIYLWLTLHTSIAVAGTGLMNSIFSGIGRRKLQLCMESDYLVLCQDDKKKRAIKKRGYASGGRLVVVSDPYDTASSSSEEDDELQWQSVRHFVLVEVQIGDRVPDALKCLLSSIAASPLAKEQIGVVLAVHRVTSEEDYGDYEYGSGFRGAGNKKRGERGIQRLEKEFRTSFRWLTTVHEEALRGDASGSKAALHISDFVKKTQEVRAHMALITHTTADAVFHPQYFAALTFAFLASGKVRNTTIWQPPVFQLKDYWTQSAVTRHVALFLAQDQLSSLTDPLAVPLPKSTYSLPLNLVRAASGCWEPNFYSPDVVHNTGVWTKCWLTTIGRSSVQPIFLPVICSAVPQAHAGISERKGNADSGRPSGSGASSSSSSADSAILPMCFRLSAQGLLELSYFWGALPLALLGRRGSRSVHLGRLLCLVGRSVPPLLRTAWVHIVMSSFFLSVSVNVLWLILRFFISPPATVYTSQSLLSISAVFYGVILLPIVQIMAHLSLIRVLTPIIPPPTDTKVKSWWHALRLGLSGLYAGPVFFVMVAMAEWHAALQICTLGCSRNNSVEGLRQDLRSPQSRAAASGEPPSDRSDNRSDNLASLLPRGRRPGTNGSGDSVPDRRNYDGGSDRARYERSAERSERSESAAEHRRYSPPAFDRARYENAFDSPCDRVPTRGIGPY